MSERTPDIAEPLARGGRMDSATEAFVAHRNLLFTVAYEMLGSAADAEDVLQETWLRWVDVDLDPVRDQRAYLVRITTRQALSRLRTLRRRKESYVGPWLPEPLLTAPDVAEDVEQDCISRSARQIASRPPPFPRMGPALVQTEFATTAVRPPDHPRWYQDSLLKPHRPGCGPYTCFDKANGPRFDRACEEDDQG